MPLRPPPRWTWPLTATTALLAGLAGSAWLVRADWSRHHEAFETDARIAHRLLSQRAAQLDAILATLTLLQAGNPPGADRPEQRLPALYPQIQQVLRRDRGDPWPAALAAAEAASAQAHRAVLAELDLARGRYTLVRAGEPASFAVRIAAAEMLPWDEWPLPRDTPVRVLLQHAGQTFVVQPGASNPHITPPSLRDGWRFSFDKPLASASQPLQLVLATTLPWSAIAWGRVALWWLAVVAIATAVGTALRQREARRRAEELLRLGQVGRLNAMGEMAAGIAHELNQPLTAVLANTQAAQRLLAGGAAPQLADDPAQAELLDRALAQGVQQARRAAEVVARLRRLVQSPDAESRPEALALAGAVRNVLYLLAPEAELLGVQAELQAGTAASAQVLTDPVALEQIVHNLVQNALQALAAVPAGRRRLVLEISPVSPMSARQVALRVRDNGPGFATPEALARAFEPFYTTRSGGLGLGLSLCETLAAGMGGSLTARNHPEGGAELTLVLPAAPGSAPVAQASAPAQPQDAAR